MRRPLAFVVLLLAALALGACDRTEDPDLPTGPLDKDAYVSAFERSADGLANRYELDSREGGDVARVERIQKVLRAWAVRLDGLQPPVEARAAHRQYVAGLRGFADDLDRPLALLKAGRTGEAQDLLESGRALSARTRRDLHESRAAFGRLGYDINNLDQAPVPDTGE